MKIVKRVLLALVIIIVVALAVVYFKLNSIVKTVVEEQATASLNVPTSLGSADIQIFGGKVGLNNLEISSPQGFTAPKIFTLGGVSVDAKVSELRQKPLKVNEIIIDKPKLVIEQAGGKLNFMALMDQLPKSEPPKDSSGEPSEPLKLIINTLQLKDAEVTIRPGQELAKFGVDQDLVITVPSTIVKDIGTGEGNQNGAAIKEVVMKAIEGLVASVKDSSKIPPALKPLLAGNFEDMKRAAVDAGRKKLEEGKEKLQQKAAEELNKIGIGGNKEGSTTQPSKLEDKAKEGLNKIFGK